MTCEPHGGAPCGATRAELGFDLTRSRDESERELCPSAHQRQLRPSPADCNRMEELTETLTRAFDRIGDFQAVQAAASGDELLGAVIRLQESVGIDDDVRGLIAERLEEIRGSQRAPGHVLLGLILGLTAAALETEKPRR